MLIDALANPKRSFVRFVGVALAVLALGQVLWDARTSSAEPVSRALPLEARAITVSSPMGTQLPPAPTLKMSIPANPFRQLDRIGLEGYELRLAAEDLGVDITPVVAFDLTDIDVSGINDQDRKCLTQAIYYEARNQNLAGQMAVADVVLNRVASSRYPDTICEVVYQGSHRTTGCQFTFTCDGSLAKPIERRPMIRSQILATAILGGFHLPLSGEATNYHAGYVSPYWAPTLDETRTVGDHIFYKRGENFDTYIRKKAALKQKEAALTSETVPSQYPAAAPNG